MMAAIHVCCYSIKLHQFISGTAVSTVLLPVEQWWGKNVLGHKPEGFLKYLLLLFKAYFMR